MDENIECKENWMLNALAESHLELLPGRLPFVSDWLVCFLAGWISSWLAGGSSWLAEQSFKLAGVSSWQAHFFFWLADVSFLVARVLSYRVLLLARVACWLAEVSF